MAGYSTKSVDLYCMICKSKTDSIIHYDNTEMCPMCFKAKTEDLEFEFDEIEVIIEQ